MHKFPVLFLWHLLTKSADTNFVKSNNNGNNLFKLPPTECILYTALIAMATFFTNVKIC